MHYFTTLHLLISLLFLSPDLNAKASEDKPAFKQKKLTQEEMVSLLLVMTLSHCAVVMLNFFFGSVSASVLPAG